MNENSIQEGMVVALKHDLGKTFTVALLKKMESLQEWPFVTTGQARAKPNPRWSQSPFTLKH